MQITEKHIEKLEAAGGNVWEKGNMHRIYFSARDLGLVCEYYRTGNVKNAWHCGDSISNSEANRMKWAKSYIDMEDGTVHSTNVWLERELQKILDEVLATVAAEEQAEAEAAATEQAATETIATVETVELIQVVGVIKMARAGERVILRGKRGGLYYITAGGKKCYIKATDARVTID